MKKAHKYRQSEHSLNLTLPAGLFFIILAIASCQPAQYRRDADRVAAKIIEQKQKEALGHTEPFTIESPAETLRKRLLMIQNLPNSGPESLGAYDLATIPHWPEKKTAPKMEHRGALTSDISADKPLHISLLDALAIAAGNNREYMSRKEDVFLAALNLDLERREFRNTYAGILDALLGREQFGEGIIIEEVDSEGTISGFIGSALASWTRKFKSGATLAAKLFVDVVRLLSLDRNRSTGILFDASIAVPLMRGSGEHIVTEPMKQAERDVLYAIYRFERFKSSLAVQVSSDYLGVLSQLDKLKNSEENYKRLQVSAERARRLAEAGRLPEIQVDQADQDLLRALDRLVADQEAYAQAQDAFKLQLGLPADALIELDKAELAQLADSAADAVASGRLSPIPDGSKRRVDNRESYHDPESPGAFARLQINAISPDMQPLKSVEIALKNRQDLRILKGEVYDAQRKVVVAADALRADLNLQGDVLVGSRRAALTASLLEDSRLRFADGSYTARLNVDLPWERTAERNLYRETYINLERAIRSVQEQEDQIKLAVRNGLRRLGRARESYRIQSQSLALAKKRVVSTELFLDAGRAQVRDLLEAQEALISSQNAVTTALVNYRITQLELMRDMDILKIDHKGLWSQHHGALAGRK